VVGQTLSHYRIIEKIGQGGMGEVYRAEDTSLKREVAIKVLPEQFTQDPQRLARFEREAQLLASLNHPNIAAIYELEEADGVRFLSLELVEGETLAERVAQGPLPVEEALEVCRQIAEGVEAAHEKGVIHRDLKPANVKITPEGKVKVLDFGLAKAFEEETAVADISQSPTLTEEMTKAGMILGTAAYMSPEQARGKPVDKRTDIWAFGCVLFECLTAKRAFEGETVTDTLAKVLEGEPKWEALPDNTPSLTRFLLRQCLQKSPHDRLHEIADVRIGMEQTLSEPTTVDPTGVISRKQPSRWKIAIPWSIVVVIAVAGIAIRILTGPVPQPLTQFLITPPSTSLLMSFPGKELAIASDGRRIVYLAQGEGNRQLYLHSLDELIATPIAGTEGAFPGFFFSPDGESMAFFATGQLKKVSLMGGAAITLCDAPASRGGSWDSEDTIVFSANSESGFGLQRVSAAGGTPEILASPDPDKGEIVYRNPEILPGGKAVLFTVFRGLANYETAVLSLETGEQKILMEGGRAAHYTSTGHLVYATATGTLMAVPFDLARLEVTGESVPVLQGVRQVPFAEVDYAFSADGTLVYVPAGESAGRTLVWVNRQGTEQLVTEEKRNFTVPRISPDGKRLALSIREDDGTRDVWIYDTERDSFSRLTFDGALYGPMIWTPDSKWITFGSPRDGPLGNLYRKLADGSGPAERLTTSQYNQNPDSWSPDGSVLVFRETSPNTERDVWILPMDGDRKPELLISSPLLDCCARFSPDGKWLAYVSNETGRHHVYVSPYPEANVKWLVSGEAGGGGPVWSPDGTEIFYRRGNQMMVVSVQTKPTFSAGKPRVLFEGAYVTSPALPGVSQYHDIHPDGQRFLMIKEDQSGGQINVVLNWFEELKRLVPTD